MHLALLADLADALQFTCVTVVLANDTRDDLAPTPGEGHSGQHCLGHCMDALRVPVWAQRQKDSCAWHALCMHCNLGFSCPLSSPSGFRHG